MWPFSVYRKVQVLPVQVQAARVRHSPANSRRQTAHNLLDVDFALFPVHRVRNVCDLEYVLWYVSRRVLLSDRRLKLVGEVHS